jgi:putative transposase
VPATACFRRRLLCTSIALALGSATTLAQSDPVLKFCTINGLDACAMAGALVEPAAVFVFRGYLYDLDTGDRPSGTGYFILRNTITYDEYRVELQGVEARPDVMADIIAERALLGDVMPDHVHLLVEVDPQYGIAKLVRTIKGRSSRRLREEFRWCRTRLPSLWTSSYFVATVGGAPLEVIKQYIEQQKHV